jgi:L1 cell adhesion molecule like protein
VDANGILNVSALEKSCGKQEKITITNDKGRLSKEEIDKMVQDAERFKNEDEAQRDKVAAKNGLEAYIFNMKASLDQPEVKSKLSEAELSEARTKLESALAWLDRNQLAEKEEFVEKQKELERELKKFIEKLYGGAAGSGSADPMGGCGQQARHGNREPTIEEVD